MDDNIVNAFTKDELLKLTIVQLKELFKWYGLTYPSKGKKEDIINELFVDAQKLEEDEIPRSVRIRRIYDATN